MADFSDETTKIVLFGKLRISFLYYEAYLAEGWKAAVRNPDTLESTHLSLLRFIF